MADISLNMHYPSEDGLMKESNIWQFKIITARILNLVRKQFAGENQRARSIFKRQRVLRHAYNYITVINAR